MTEKELTWYNINKRGFNGFTSQMYRTQRHSSKRRGHNLPNYSLETLRQWLLKQPNFNDLWNNWVNSGYDTWLKPSIDRIDDSKGYMINNFRLVTWKENHEKNRRVACQIGGKRSALLRTARSQNIQQQQKLCIALSALL